MHLRRAAPFLWLVAGVQLVRRGVPRGVHPQWQLLQLLLVAFSTGPTADADHHHHGGGAHRQRARWRRHVPHERCISSAPSMPRHSHCTHCCFRARAAGSCWSMAGINQPADPMQQGMLQHANVAQKAAALGWCRPRGTPLPMVGPPTPAAPQGRTSVLQPHADFCSPHSGEH